MKRTHLQLTGLILVSLIAFALFRGEIEWHGWEALNWTKYFHYAIPVGASLFVLWANFQIQLSPGKRVLLNLIAVLWGTIAYFLLAWSLRIIFTPGPMGMAIHLSYSESTLFILRSLPFLLTPALPISVFLIARIFRLKLRFLPLLLSILMMFLSFPLCIWILDITNHRGSPDLIHTLKSGLIVPCWIFFTGLPLLFHKKQNTETQKMEE